MSSILDIFMPEDLCARCSDEEPLREFSLMAEHEDGNARLSFCSEFCRDAFYDGWKALHHTNLS